MQTLKNIPELSNFLAFLLYKVPKLIYVSLNENLLEKYILKISSSSCASSTTQIS